MTRYADNGLTTGLVPDHRPGVRGEVDAALIDLVTRGEIAPDSTVLHAHVGGRPALNGYSALFS